MRVILLKEPDDSEAAGGAASYATALASVDAAVACAFVPVLALQRRADGVAAAQRRVCSAWAGEAGAPGLLLVTSPQAAAIAGELLTAAFRECGLPRRGGALPVCVLGRKSCDALLRGLDDAAKAGICIKGTEAGSAEALAPVAIAAASAACGPVLFLAGDKRLDKLPAACGAAGVTLEEVTVYSCGLRPPETVAAELWASLPPAACTPVVFFSPSGVEALAAAQGKLAAGGASTGGSGSSNGALAWQDGLCALPVDASTRRACAVAIGPTTSKALTESGIPVAAVCAAPNPQGVAAAVAQLLAPPA